ncbi:MAG: hypothetical protein QG665_299 [Patescibacteria group bacterium]|nr:hypothetical protein [Patescibacteria group bacterium]
MNLDIDNLIVFLLLGLIGVLAFWVVTLEWRLKNIFRGNKISSLESVIVDLGQAVDEIIDKGKNDDRLFEDIYRRLKGVLQRCHTIRFNPFADQGGNQSFATAIMDEEGDGVVISSLYSRDKVSVYAKPLKKFASAHELSSEETQAIAEAKK